MANFDTFKSSFRGDILTPVDPGYDQAITRWAKNAERKATVVAFVNDAEDVSKAILYAKAANLLIAIKGGGHNVAGASSSEGGLVIDLSRYLGGVRIDAEKKLGYAGGGALWESVDKTAIEHGLATVGGTVNHTGVGGLILGGGYGWLSGAYGLVIDNLVQATIVTADGSIHTANESENADLFWGIRGAGSNFGVVTEFVLKLYPQRRTIYAGPVIYTPDQLDAVLGVTQAWWSNGPSEKEGIIQVFTRGPDRQPCIVTFLFYNGSEAEGKENYKAFLDLKPVMDLTAERPYEELNTLQNQVALPGQNAYMKGCFAPNTFPRALLPQVFSRVQELSASSSHQMALIFEYFPLNKINAVPDDATAYRRGLTPNVLCVINAKEDTHVALRYSRESAQELLGLITGKSPDNMGYGNYSPDSDALPTDGSVLATKAEVNFGSNYRRLQEIKKEYDPEIIFKKWFVITPAV